MTPYANRRLTVKDMMVLVAATAVGIAWARGGWDWMYMCGTKRTSIFRRHGDGST